MPRKILLSFLGTNNYEPVSYYVERSAGNAPVEKYVQKTILNYLAGSFGPNDQAFIFLTDEARNTNWDNDGHFDYKTKAKIPNTGLAKQIETEAYHFGVSPIQVNSESEPEAIWETFERVYECIQPEDEVYLDITHSWRYLPMLGMTLLNYAKVLKRIQVRAIYYGAFEQLGTFQEVKKMPLDGRPVPILNLVSFSELQDWTVAADDFVLDGNPDRLAALTNKNLSGIMRSSQGKDEVAKNMREVTSRINQLVPLITTNRGSDLWKYDYEALQQALDRFSGERSYIKPLNDVVEHIKNKVQDFQAEGHFQWLESVAWCIEHRLVQQGITQLQEGLVSWLCQYYEQKQWAEPGFFDMHKNGRGRDLITKAIQFIGNAPPEEKWKGVIGRRPELGYRVMEDALAQELHKPFAKLTAARNDINHGGYIEEKMKKADRFYTILEDCYSEIATSLERFLPTQQTGLLNLSNHPSDGWSQEQKQAALEQYNTITDKPFPAIAPDLGDDQLQQLVDEYFNSIVGLSPTAVHIMGEMTFTFALVQRLKAAGIPCIASTTERRVTEEGGKKIVTFQFVRFRPY